MDDGIKITAIESKNNNREDSDYISAFGSGSKVLNVSYCLTSKGSSEYIGTMDIFSDGQISYSALSSSAVDVLHTDYAQICGENAKPKGEGNSLSDDTKGKERYERTKTILRDKGVTIISLMESKKEVFNK